jgi:hypothetical protein
VKSFHRIILILAALTLAPAKIFACAACYANGANINDPMAAGMNWAILTLGLIVATVLGAFLTFLVHVIRKSEALEAAAQKNAPADRSNLGRPRRDKAEPGENTGPACAAGYGLPLGSPKPSQL